MKDFLDLASLRYSCRSYSPAPVDPVLVDKVLEAGRIAPTAVDFQPIHIWAVTSAQALDQVMGTTRSSYRPPVVLAVGYNPSEAWVRRYDGVCGGPVDVAIVTTHMMLQATELGLASLWVGSFDPKALAAVLPGSEGYEMVSMLYVGYPSVDAVPSPRHFERKTLEDIVTRL